MTTTISPEVLGNYTPVPGKPAPNRFAIHEVYSIPSEELDYSKIVSKRVPLYWSPEDAYTLASAEIPEKWPITALETHSDGIHPRTFEEKKWLLDRYSQPAQELNPLQQFIAIEAIEPGPIPKDWQFIAFDRCVQALPFVRRKEARKPTKWLFFNDNQLLSFSMNTYPDGTRYILEAVSHNDPAEAIAILNLDSLDTEALTKGGWAAEESLSIIGTCELLRRTIMMIGLRQIAETKKEN